MEYFNELKIVPLQRRSREEHVRHFSEGKCGVRLQEFNVRGRYIDVPFCKICVHQYEKIDDIGEAERQTGEQDREEGQALANIVHDVPLNCVHYGLFESRIILESFVDGQIQA